MNRTIYVRNADVQTWEQAKRIAELQGVELSAVTAHGLRRYVAANQKATKVRRSESPKGCK